MISDFWSILIALCLVVVIVIVDIIWDRLQAGRKCPKCGEFKVVETEKLEWVDDLGLGGTARPVIVIRRECENCGHKLPSSRRNP